MTQNSSLIISYKEMTKKTGEVVPQLRMCSVSQRLWVWFPASKWGSSWPPLTPASGIFCPLLATDGNCTYLFLFPTNIAGLHIILNFFKNTFFKEKKWLRTNAETEVQSHQMTHRFCWGHRTQGLYSAWEDRRENEISKTPWRPEEKHLRLLGHIQSLSCVILSVSLRES